MIRLTKSYALLRFLNRSPGPLMRGLLAGAGWITAWVFTGSRVLAADMRRSLMTDANLKHSLRRLAWYGARSRLKVEPVKDPVFDFAQGRSPVVLEAQAAFIARRGKGDITQQLDHLTVLAARPQPDWAAVSHSINTVLDTALALPAVSPAPATPSRTGDFPVADAARALRDFADLYPNGTIPWYVISGTFLGLVREDGFLPHDYDIDLGIHAEDADLPAMIAAAQADPRFTVTDIADQITLTRQTQKVLPILFKLVHQDGVHIDVFVHYVEGNLRWHGSNVHRWDNTAFDLAPYTLAGVPVFGPADADRYLTENYGDWRTPVTDFNPSFGTPNLRVVQNLASLVLCLKRYALAHKQGLTLAEDIVSRLKSEGYLVQQGDRLRFNPARFDTAVDGSAAQG